MESIVASNSFLPNTDAALLSWSLNFNTLITASATAYGLTAALATAYGALHASYAGALAGVAPAIRTKGAVQAKNSARASLKANARLLANLVEGTASVTNAQKATLGLTVRVKPTPSPIPALAPGVDVLSVSAWSVKIKLHDAASSAKRGRPPGVSGANLFSFVGATPPGDVSGWTFEGNTGKTDITISFANTLVPGTKVWFSAVWFNGRKQSGPVSTPVSANLPGGSMSMAA